MCREAELECLPTSTSTPLEYSRVYYSHVYKLDCETPQKERRQAQGKHA